MLTGFKSFVSNAWSAVTNFFSKMGDWFKSVLAGTKSEVKDSKVAWTFPNYSALAEQMQSAINAADQPDMVGEVTKPGDKGRKIASQIQDYGLVSRKMSPNQAQELETNVAVVASSLGYAFETGIVVYLVEQKGLKMIGNQTIQKVQDRHNLYIGRVQDSWRLSTRGTKARDKFIELLQHNVAWMAEQIYDKSKEFMKCQNLEFIEYVGLEQQGQGHTDSHSGGADLIVSCSETGETTYWSTKYGSNPHGTIGKKSPADVSHFLGGRGNRSDEYYARLTANIPESGRADAVLYDLWDSLRKGYAAIKQESPVKVIMDAEWVASIFHELVRGNTGTNPAWANYAAGRSAVGDYSTALQRDLRIGKDNALHSREGATAEATLDGAYKLVSSRPGAKRPKPAIKIKLVTPGQLGRRQTYMKIYVNDAPPGENRYANYNVQIQMNNLTTE